MDYVCKRYATMRCLCTVKFTSASGMNNTSSCVTLTISHRHLPQEFLDEPKVRAELDFPLKISLLCDKHTYRKHKTGNYLPFPIFPSCTAILPHLLKALVAFVTEYTNPYVYEPGADDARPLVESRRFKGYPTLHVTQHCPVSHN